MDYYIREVRPNQFQVAKFDQDHKRPLEVYSVSFSACTCPSPKYPCKHAQLVHQWKAVPQHTSRYYDDTDGLFHLHPFTGDPT